MSKLPHAPLVEVIFELHWPSVNSANLNKFEMMLGAMFVELKTEFPNIIHLRQDPLIPLNIFLNKPTHRFKPDPKKGEYPIYQLGPGILTVNTIDDYYDWNVFSGLILKVSEVLGRIYNFDPKGGLTFGLKYLDFYELDFSNDVRESYNKLFNFNIDVSSAIPKETSPFIFNLESSYLTPNGAMSFSIKRGKIKKQGVEIEGLICESGIQLKIGEGDHMQALKKWLESSHDSLSGFFKDITKGSTYESFK